MSEEAVSAELCNLRGLCQAICYLFKKLNVFLHQLNPLIMVIEPASCRLLLRVARMDMDGNL